MNLKKILIGKWSWKRPIYSLASIYTLLFLISCTLTDRILFIPPPSSYGDDLPGLEYIASTKQETTAVLHLKAAPGKPTILFSHGNAEDMGSWLPIFEEWHSMGLGVLAYDYPGYGKSAGKPSEASCQRSIADAHKFLTSHGVPNSSIVIVGRSVGSGPSVWLASEMNAKALILISPFKSVFTVAFPTPFPLFPGDRFPNYKRIKNITTPLLVIHGENDEVIPFSHGKKLFELSPSPTKEFFPIPNTGHNDLFNTAADAIIARVAAFATQ